MATVKRKPAKTTEPNHAAIPARVWQRYKAARMAREQWAEAEKNARDDIETLAGENEFIELPDGTPLVKWAQLKVGRFNTAAFKRDHPDLYAEYTEQKSERRFNLEDGALDG